MDKKLHKTTITVEVLSEEPFDFRNLSDVHYAITEGECSGIYSTTKTEVLDTDKAIEECEKQGSDPNFFALLDDWDEV